MKPPADIARALLNERCPHASVNPAHSTLGQRHCTRCLTAALVAYGDVRAAEARKRGIKEMRT